MGTRGLFLQLTNACAKQNKVICASGATPRIEWMFRNHEVSYKTVEEESHVKAQLQSNSNSSSGSSSNSCDRILLFVTVQEALEFCENVLIHQKLYCKRNKHPLLLAGNTSPLLRPLSGPKNSNSN